MSDKVLKILKIIGMVFVICLAITPLIVLLFVLRGYNKTIKFYPKFEIVDITNTEIIDTEALKSGLNKVKGDFKL